jgi:hypothetical protein
MKKEKRVLKTTKENLLSAQCWLRRFSFSLGKESQEKSSKLQ